LAGAVRTYPDEDQFWWMAVPPGLPGPVEAATVVVELPAGARIDQRRSVALAGRRPIGANGVDRGEARFSTHDLPPGSGFEARIHFQHGFADLDQPGWQRFHDWGVWFDSSLRPWLNPLLVILSAGIVIVGLIRLTDYRGASRGRRGSRAETQPICQPPSDLPAGVVGFLVDGRLAWRHLPATLLDLSRRGLLRVVEAPSVQSSDGEQEPVLELRTAGVFGLGRYERGVLGVLFGSASRIGLSRATERWYAQAELVHYLVYEEAARLGLIVERPELSRSRWRAWLLGLVLTGLALALVLGAGARVVAELIWAPFLALALVGLAWLIACPGPKLRTRTGTVEAGRWLAFADYLASPRAPDSVDRAQLLAEYMHYLVALATDWGKSRPRLAVVPQARVQSSAT
jgi:hypothetical protein